MVQRPHLGLGEHRHVRRVRRPEAPALPSAVRVVDAAVKARIREFLRHTHRELGTTLLLTTHDLDDIEELCRRIMIIDHGRLLYDGPLGLLKQKLLRTKQVKFVLKDSEQVPHVTGLASGGLRLDQGDELTYRIVFDRSEVSTADLIRQVLDTVEVRDLLIEDEPIEEIVKRIYAGEALRGITVA